MWSLTSPSWWLYLQRQYRNKHDKETINKKKHESKKTYSQWSKQYNEISFRWIRFMALQFDLSA